MSSHIIPHRGLDYHLTPTIDYDGRTVMDLGFDFARWRSREETVTVLEDFFDYGLGAAFWPSTIPSPDAKVPDGLAAFLFGTHEDDIRAALEREIVDQCLAVQAATE